MKTHQAGFIGIAIAIIVALALMAGGTYYITKQKHNVKVEKNISTTNQDLESATSSSNSKIYTNTQFGVSFSYPDDKVSISNNNIFNKNSGRFVNFDIKSGGNFAFDILQDSDKMTPPHTTEIDEVKFKMSISAGWGDITKLSELKLGGQAAYKMQVYTKGYNDPHECIYEKIVTKKDGYWYEFYAKVCDGNIDASQSLKMFESIATTLSFTK